MSSYDELINSYSVEINRFIDKVYYLCKDRLDILNQDKSNNDKVIEQECLTLLCFEKSVEHQLEDILINLILSRNTKVIAVFKERFKEFEYKKKLVMSILLYVSHNSLSLIENSKLYNKI